MQRVIAVLWYSNYPISFIQNCERALTKQPAENNFNGSLVLPYVPVRFQENRSHFETTKSQSSLQTTTNHQQPFSATQRDRQF